MLQKLKVTSSIALTALFLLVTTHQSNASTQSQQSNTLTNFKHGYLPNYTVNSIDSEQTEIKLANSWGHHKKRMTKRRRYSTRYKNSQRYREWKQRKAARSRHHYRLRSVKRAYYKKIKRAERQVIRLQSSKRSTIKKLDARYKTNIKRINAQLRKVLAARKSRIKARRAKAEAEAQARAKVEAQARAKAEAQARANAEAAARAEKATQVAAPHKTGTKLPQWTQRGTEKEVICKSESYLESMCWKAIFMDQRDECYRFMSDEYDKGDDIPWPLASSKTRQDIRSQVWTQCMDPSIGTTRYQREHGYSK